MNECMARDIQEMLPDLLHTALPADQRERVEQHLAACESCREELAVLRTVRDAAVFAPAIDAARIARQIPPYRAILPAPAPARSRVAQWLVAATAAVLIIGGGSVVMNRGSATPDKVAVAAPPTDSGASQPDRVPAPGEATVASAGSQSAQVPTFALASDVASLSDGDLVQLMNDMDDFDALPAAEPDPVIAVDSGDSL
ncbi:MAG TPA: zf-HC2 domain-containing protein [Gemmatimonadaceae bacterium]|nr:zf-HC2 domain-containing protein [Gemmatimonadaceae bacterium]